MRLDERIKVRVSCREYLTKDIVLYKLEPLEGLSLPSFSAGSHIEVHISAQFTRAYSLCSDPAFASTHYCIAVKIEDTGRGGSKSMHNSVFVGTELSISPPKNFFPLAARASHHLLIAGGIGLTPMLSMTYSLHARGEPFTLVVCASSSEKLPFFDILNNSPWHIHYFLNGRESIDLTTILSSLPDDPHIYCCGPEGLMSMAKTNCEVLARAHWHEERFAAKTGEIKSNQFELYLSESDQRVVVEENMTMMSALRNVGIHVESVCEQGICGSCLVRWRDGNPIHRDECLEPEERDEYVALCCAGCNSSSLTLEL